MSALFISSVRWLSLLKVLDALFQSILRLFLTWILVPQEFGIYGGALLFIGLVQTTTQTGVIQALIQKKNMHELLNTGWTLQVIRGALIYVLIYFLTPLYVAFMEVDTQESMINAIRILGLIIILDSFKNIGVITFDKEINFDKVFKLEISGLLVKFFATLFFTLLLESFYGLVYGTLLGYITVFLMSYILSSYRPRIEVDKEKILSILNYGVWVFIFSITNFLIIRINELFLLKFVGLEELAIFQLALFMALFARDSITQIQSRIVFPIISRYQNSGRIVRKVFVKNFQIASLIYIPIGTFLFAVSYELVQVFLDPNWRIVSEVLPYLSIAAIFSSFTAIIEKFYNGLGIPNRVFFFSILSLLVLLLSVNFIFGYGLVEISKSFLVATTFHFILIFSYFVKFSSLKLTDFGSKSLFTFLRSFFPFLSIQLCLFLFDLNSLISLILGSIFSFSLYFVLILLLDKSIQRAILKDYLRIAK